MQYGDIQTEVIGLLNRRDCTSAQAQSFITMALQRIQRELLCPAMEKSVIATIGASYSGLVIPSDFLELINLIPISVSVVDQERMEKADVTQVLQLSSQTGVPRKYYRQGGSWLLGPSPSTGDQIRIDYYAEFTPLSAATDQNIATISFPDLLIYGALSLAGDWFTDKRTATWEARYNQILKDLTEMAQDDEMGGAAAVQPAYTFPDTFGFSEECGW